MTRPIYDIARTYQQNLEEGPFFDGEIPTRTLPPREEWVDFLGIPVASRLGVAAGPLLDSKWIKFAADLGFDILTYKTVRSHPHPAYFPNILFLDENRKSGETIYQRHDLPPQEEISITNSFGNPTQSDAFLAKDVPAAIDSVGPGQAFVSSIVGTPRSDISMQGDFVVASSRAKEWGSPVVEANFSCPNVKSADGCLYQSPEAFATIGRALVKALGDTPLIVKMGAITDPVLLRKILIEAARAGVRAIAGINTVKMRVLNDKNVSPLGPDRPFSGACGNVVRETGLKFVRLARTIIDREKLDLTLIGLGGILLPEHFDQFLEYADFAQLATGMMWDPLIASKWRNLCLKRSYATSTPSSLAPLP